MCPLVSTMHNVYMCMCVRIQCDDDAVQCDPSSNTLQHDEPFELPVAHGLSKHAGEVHTQCTNLIKEKRDSNTPHHIPHSTTHACLCIIYDI